MAQKVTELSWESSTRLLVHFGDAPCHGSRYHGGVAFARNGPDTYPHGNPDGEAAPPHGRRRRRWRWQQQPQCSIAWDGGTAQMGAAAQLPPHPTQPHCTQHTVGLGLVCEQQQQLEQATMAAGARA